MNISTKTLNLAIESLQDDITICKGHINHAKSYASSNSKVIAVLETRLKGLEESILELSNLRDENTYF